MVVLGFDSKTNPPTLWRHSLWKKINIKRKVIAGYCWIKEYPIWIADIFGEVHSKLSEWGVTRGNNKSCQVTDWGKMIFMGRLGVLDIRVKFRFWISSFDSLLSLLALSEVPRIFFVRTTDSYGSGRPDSSYQLPPPLSDKIVFECEKSNPTYSFLLTIRLIFPPAHSKLLS